MKKPIFVILLFLALIAIVYLVQSGIIAWQPLTIVAAAIAAPFKFIMGLFGNKEEEIRKKHAQLREQETSYQESLDTAIKGREREIGKLNKEVEILDSKIELLKKKRDLIDTDVENMSLEEIQKEWQKRFGSKSGEEGES